MTRKSKRRRAANNRIWIIGGLVAAVLIVAVLILANQPNTVAALPAKTALTECGKPECGPANAPVTVDEYSDFQ